MNLAGFIGKPPYPLPQHPNFVSSPASKTHPAGLFDTMNKLLTILYILCFLLTVHLVSAAPAVGSNLPHLFRRRHAPVEKVETQAEHLARFQVQLTNALGLQPHQVCVLHHALLAQTEAPLPGVEVPSAPAPTLTEALRAVLRADQMMALQALPANEVFIPEFAALSVRP